MSDMMVSTTMPLPRTVDLKARSTGSERAFSGRGTSDASGELDSGEGGAVVVTGASLQTLDPGPMRQYQGRDGGAAPVLPPTPPTSEDSCFSGKTWIGERRSLRRLER